MQPELHRLQMQEEGVERSGLTGQRSGAAGPVEADGGARPPGNHVTRAWPQREVTLQNKDKEGKKGAVKF